MDTIRMIEEREKLANDRIIRFFDTASLDARDIDFLDPHVQIAYEFDPRTDFSIPRILIIVHIIETYDGVRVCERAITAPCGKLCELAEIMIVCLDDEDKISTPARRLLVKHTKQLHAILYEAHERATSSQRASKQQAL